MLYVRTKMVKYKCGHNTNGVIIMDSNPLSISAYLDWKDSVGFEGDSSQCFDCYCAKCGEQNDKHKISNLHNETKN